jgi:hypothetical protein
MSIPYQKSLYNPEYDPNGHLQRALERAGGVGITHGCYNYLTEVHIAAGVHDSKEARPFFTNAHLLVREKESDNILEYGKYEKLVDLSSYEPVHSGLRIHTSNPSEYDAVTANRQKFIDTFVQNGLPKLCGVWLTTNPESINEDVNSTDGYDQDWCIYEGYTTNDKGEHTLVFRNQNHETIYFSASEPSESMGITYGGQSSYVKGIFITPEPGKNSVE